MVKGNGRLKLKYKILFVTFVGIVGLDQASKWAVTEKFHLGESISLISQIFNFTYVQNKGAAFGFMSQADPAFRVPFFIIVPFVALGSIAMAFKKLGQHELKFAAALSLVISGAVGNLIDRLRLGYVIDFIDFHWKNQYHFPAFNIADSAICIGVALILMDLFSSSSSRSRVSRMSESSLSASSTYSQSLILKEKDQK